MCSCQGFRYRFRTFPDAGELLGAGHKAEGGGLYGPTGAMCFEPSQEGVVLSFFSQRHLIETAARQVWPQQLEHVVRLALTCGYFREGLFLQLSNAKGKIGGGVVEHTCECSAAILQ